MDDSQVCASLPPVVFGNDMFTTDALSAALADRYAIERLIGEGGMAKVYLARDLRHHRRVALKVLRPDLGAVVGIDRFQAEIRVTANLQHPNLLPLFDSGVAGELLFYVMPNVEGESLRARIDREKQLPVEEAIRIAAAIAGALDYAHRHGVVHRDLKPENILIQEGQPLVADFGIALAISNAGGARITQTGLSLGTPQYMSPEQATGDRQIDGRTDIYSLGALTYEMLTGEPPHVGSTSQAIIARVLTERPRSIRATRASVPEHVEAAVHQALEKLPADRWATARDFADALTGARAITRRTIAVAAAPPAVPRAAKVREAIAWTLAGLAVATAYVVVRTNRPAAAPAVRAEFEVAIPDSLDLVNLGSAASIALSRDGRTLVFVGARRSDRQPMLYSRHLGERFVQEIRGTEGARSPVFSPDGSELLFALFQTGTGAALIKRIEVGGGVARTFSEVGPRNGQISWREPNQVVMALNGGDGPNGLWLVDAQSGSRTLLAAVDTARGYVQYGFPDVLPGGKAALIAMRKQRSDLDSVVLGVVTIPEGKVAELGVRGLFPRYSSTGPVIYSTPTAGLYAVPFDARSLRVTGSPTLIAEHIGAGSGGAVPMAVADNGTIAFIQGRDLGGMVQPVIVNRAGVWRSLGVARGRYNGPRVSPDGRQVAYSISTEGGSPRLGGPDIWRADVATGQAQRVTTNGASVMPVWSRDGNEIYFSIVPPNYIEYSIALSANARPKVVFRGQGLMGPSDIGPAHGYAAFGMFGPTGPDLWVAPMDSMDKARVLVAEPYDEALPRISPDGRLVAYESNRTGRYEIYVRQIAGDGQEIRVSPDGGVDPAWSHDGHELFYRGRLRDTRSMMAAQVATTPKLAVPNVRALFPLTNLFSENPARTWYDVFPNGDFLMLAERADTTKVHMPLVVRLNWASSLERRGVARTP